jgi:imidazolonepropionase-like amidohydrolase
METLTGVLRGEVLVHVHCYRADEMIQVMQLADEFGFRVRSFHHAVEAYKIRDVLAEWEVSVSTWADWWGFKMEAYDAILENAALIHEAGGRTIIHSDSPIGIQRLNQEAAKALYRGRDGGIQITEDEALRWITLNPAWSLGVDKVTGSIEVGKQADVVVWDASPFSVYARPQLVFVDGVRELDRAKLQPWSDFVVGQPFEGATGAKPQAGGGR